MDLGLEVKEYGGGRDSLVVIKDNGDIPGGVTLDVSEYIAHHPDEEYLRAGHPIGLRIGGAGLRSYHPLAIANTGAGQVYSGDAVGVLKRSVRIDRPVAAVLVQGVVNASACPLGGPAEETACREAKGLSFVHSRGSIEPQ